MFTAAPLITATAVESAQVNGSADEWVKKMWYKFSIDWW
jgi:hypothetical protein